MILANQKSNNLYISFNYGIFLSVSGIGFGIAFLY